MNPQNLSKDTASISLQLNITVFFKPFYPRLVELDEELIQEFEEAQENWAASLNLIYQKDAIAEENWLTAFQLWFMSGKHL